MKKYTLFLLTLSLSLFSLPNSFGGKTITEKTKTEEIKNKLEQIRSTMPQIIQDKLLQFEEVFFRVSQNGKKIRNEKILDEQWDKYKELLYLLTDLYWGCVASKDHRKFVNYLRDYALEILFFLILKGHANNILNFGTSLPFTPLNLNHNCDGCPCGSVYGPFSKEEMLKIIENIKKLIDFSHENIEKITNDDISEIIETVVKTTVCLIGTDAEERKYNHLFNDLIIYLLGKEELLRIFFKDLIRGWTLCCLENMPEEEMKEVTIERISIIENIINFANKIEPITKNKSIPKLIKNISEDAIKIFTQKNAEKKPETLFNNTIYDHLKSLKTNVIDELTNNTFFFYDVLKKIKSICIE